MTQLTIKIPDTKLSFFIELVQNLGFAEIENNTSQPILTEQQIHLVEIERNKKRIYGRENMSTDGDEIV